MIQTISQASENFCVHQIREPYRVSENVEKVRTIIAYIDIETLAGVTHRVYIANELGFAQRISKVFLEEDESDEETLIDISLEAVNLIVGSAKVIAQEQQENEYVITTPHFVKVDFFDVAYDEAKVITIENDRMIIAIKELHG